MKVRLCNFGVVGRYVSHLEAEMGSHLEQVNSRRVASGGKLVVGL
jgi:hypothetical protein